MKITKGSEEVVTEIIEGIKGSPKVMIQCEKVNREMEQLKQHIEAFHMYLIGKKDGEICHINLSEILYFESVDSKTFLYTECSVVEISYRLYELEDLLSDQEFIRISKSQILNIQKVKSLKPQLNRTILATLCNGERLYISRKYVPIVKKLLSI